MEHVRPTALGAPAPIDAQTPVQRKGRQVRIADARCCRELSGVLASQHPIGAISSQAPQEPARMGMAPGPAFDMTCNMMVNIEGDEHARMR